MVRRPALSSLFAVLLFALGLSISAPGQAAADPPENAGPPDPCDMPFAECGSVEVHKVDDAGAPLAGVTFSLWTDAEGEAGEPVDPAQSCTTDEAGDCTIEDVETGTYWVAEDAPLAGYDGADPQQVTIEGSECEFVADGQAADGQPAGDTDTGTETAAASAPFCFPPCFPFCFDLSFLGLTSDVQAADSPFPPCFPFCFGDLDPVSLTFVNARQAAALTVSRTVNESATTEAAPLFVGPSGTVEHVVTVANTGTLPLTLTSLTDTLQADVAGSCAQGVGSALAAGAQFLCVYSSTAAADTGATTTVGAVDQFGREVSASAQSFVDVIDPGVALSMSTSSATVPSGGGEVTYTFVVTNTGDTPLGNITVTEETNGVAGTVSAAAEGVSAASFTGGGGGVLAPGASATFQKTSHVPGGAPTTTYGRVTATHALGKAVGATSSATVTPEAVVAPAASVTAGASAEVLGVSLTNPAPAATGPALAATGWTTGSLARFGILLVLVGTALTVVGRRRGRRYPVG